MSGLKPGPRTLILIFALLIGATAWADTTGQQRAEAAGQGLVGSLAPRLVVKTIDGTTIDLGSLYGKRAVYLKFWATWCVPCREQMPHFEHVFETAGPDLAVVAINSGFNDTLDDVQRYRQRLHLTMPIVLDDGQLAAAFNLRVTPQHIVIGRDGRIQYVGHLADQQLDAALVAARISPSGGPASGPEAPAAIARLRPGDQRPATVVKTVDGQPFEFSSSDAKRSRQPTVLVFLSPWCESYLATSRPAVSASCRMTRERVATLSRGSHARWLGIASGLWADQDDLRQYQKQYSITIPLTLDESGALFREFRVTNVPTIIITDGAGRLVRRLESNNTRHLREALQSL